jgi:hypothetical protein
MLVTFRTKAHANVTMFGEVAVALLKMAGLSGNVPTGILAADLPAVLARLEGGLASQPALAPTPVAGVSGSAGVAEDPDANPVVSLGNRAFPLLALLRAAQAAGADVLVRVTR